MRNKRSANVPDRMPAGNMNRTRRTALLRLKTIFVLAVVLVLSASSMNGCSGAGGGSADDGAGDGGSAGETRQITIVTTIFPAYDWTRSILGERIDDPDVTLTLLMDNGVDFHSYQPTAGDLIAVKNCDMLIYVGGASDQWIEDALREDANPDMVVIRMMDSVGDRAVAEETVEGMTAEVEENGSDADAQAEDEEEYDEHVWLSLRNAELITADIGGALIGLDPDHADLYRANADGLIAGMRALDAEYEAVFSQGSHGTLVFGDRFPFRYLLDDYGLSYYAAFVGCSAESEASFETVRFLAEKVDELGLHYVLAESANGEKISRTIIETTGAKDQEVLLLDDMQSYMTGGSEDLTYLDRMRNNLEVFRKAVE